MRALRHWLRPEARLILAAGRADVAPADLPSLLAPGFSWPLVESFTHRQSASTAVHTMLSALPAGVVPDGVRQRLGKGSMISQFRLRCLQRALDESVATLVQAGVQPMLLKGAALAVTVYPAFAERQMQDLDLLVRPDDADRAWKALLAAGWVVAGSGTRVPFFEQHHHRPPLLAPWNGHARLELHTRLFHGGGPFAFSADDLRREAATISIGGHAALVPSLEYSLLYLCLHFAWSHTMSRGVLRTLRDLAVLWKAGARVDEDFVRLAREARAATCCYWTLRLGRRLFDVPVPVEVLAALRPPRSAWVLDMLERHYAGVAGLTLQPCPSVRLERALWSLGVMPAWSGHDVLPWAAGQDWEETSDAAPAAADDNAAPASFWGRQRRAFTALRRYATALLR